MSERISAAQIVAIVAWVSVIAAPWYAAARDISLRSPEMAGIMGIGALVGLAAGLHHSGAVARRRREAAAVTDELKNAALERMRRGGSGGGHYGPG